MTLNILAKGTIRNKLQFYDHPVGLQSCSSFYNHIQKHFKIKIDTFLTFWCKRCKIEKL